MTAFPSVQGAGLFPLTKELTLHNQAIKPRTPIHTIPPPNCLTLKCATSYFMIFNA